MENKTEQHNPNAEWHLLDAKDLILGRLATQAAHLLSGKHRADYVPNKVAPVYVVVINSDLVQVTGKKVEQKQYHHYTGYSGGLHSRTFAEQRKRDSRKIIEAAISGMLPKNLLRDDRMRHLKIYKDGTHPHLPQLSNKAS